MLRGLLAAGLITSCCSVVMAASGVAFLKIRATQPGYAEPVAVRAIIQKADGSYVPGEWGASEWPAVMLRGKAMTPETVVEVSIGETKIRIGKGPDYIPRSITTNLTEAGKTYVIPVTLQPVLDLYGKGWRAGDAHVHFFHGDNQISRQPEEAYGICAAGGLNFASLADEHIGAPLLTGDEINRIWRAYEGTECQIWAGAEAPKNAWGHHATILYDPWAIRNALPYHWGINSVHEQGGVVFPVHPDRAFPFRHWGDFNLYPFNNHYKFFPIAALAGHLLDGWSVVSDEAHGPLKLARYDKLLKLGYKIPALADSDFCMDRVNNGQKGSGFWMNYLQLEGNPVTRAGVANAIRKGRVMATTGPLVLFSVDGALPGDSLTANGTERKIRIQASYRFNPWTLADTNFEGTESCRIRTVELIRNGAVVKTWTPNAPDFAVEENVREDADAYYMVRVLGNEGEWMAGYASPIYFETSPKPRQPEVFKSIVNGRVYDSATGAPLVAEIVCMRYGRQEWTVSTDENGLFRTRVPIDAELVARDRSGRELMRGLLNYEPAYAFCHNLPDDHLNKAEAVDEFAEIVREMTWEFPIGWQNASSYMREKLGGDGKIEQAKVLSAPAALEAKTYPEIVMLITDKTRVRKGDRIHYSVLLRAPRGRPAREQIRVWWGGWDPKHPRMYSHYGAVVAEMAAEIPLVELGDGFYMLSSSMVVPEWVENSTRTTGALRFSARVQTGPVDEEVNLTLALGETRRELLVSTAWDGLPSSWGDAGVGPCLFSREGTFRVRYPDYRKIQMNITINGRELRIAPVDDTKHVADADDALFEDQLYYDAQCEPEFRNVNYRDVPREQPAATDFSGRTITNPADASGPTAVAMEPRQDAVVTSPVRLYYFVHDAGLSGAHSATVYVDGAMVSVSSLANPLVLNLAPGEHTWEVEGFDEEGNSARSGLRRFVVAANGDAPKAPLFLRPLDHTNGVFGFAFTAVPGSNYLVERATALMDWRSILRTNAFTPEIQIIELDSDKSTKMYRVRENAPGF